MTPVAAHPSAARRLSRRALLRLAAGSAAAAGLAASLGTAPAFAVAAPRAAAQATTLEFWSWNNEGAYPRVHEDAEKRFTAANPGVAIKRQYISYGDYLTKLKAAIAGGAPPDIAQIPWAGEYRDLVNSGELRPLTEDLKQGFPAFYEPVMKAISLGGDAWSVPLDLNTLQIAYNKQAFADLGASIPKTQDDLIALAKQAQEKGMFGIALGTKDLWAGGDTWFAQVAYTDPTHAKLIQADAGELPWTDPSFLDAARNVERLVKEGVFAPGANSMEVFVGAQNLFVQGQAIMFYPVGNFVTGGLTEKIAGRFEYDLFPTPPPSADMEPLPTGGVAEMFVVLKKGKNPELAVEFLRYLTNDDGKKALVANDFIPSSEADISANSSPLYKNMYEAQAKAQSRVIYTTRVYSALLNSMQGLIAGELTPEQVVENMEKAKTA